MCGPLAGVIASGLGTVVSTIGAIQQGRAQKAMYDADAAIQTQNAAISNRQAEDTVDRGATEMTNLQRKAAGVIGQQRSAIGASGLAATGGSPAGILDDSQDQLSLDMAALRSNIQREKWGYDVQEWNYSNQAKMDKAAGKNAMAAAKTSAFSTFLSGAATTSDYWSKYQANKPKIGKIS